jgi:hypothetical protein
VKAPSFSFRNLLALGFSLAVVACAQLQGLDAFEKVDYCVEEGCDGGTNTTPPGTTTDSSTNNNGDANRPDGAQPGTCPPCDNGTVCDQKSLKCVECLPGTKECGPGFFCDPDETAGYKCALGCGTVQDCLVAIGADAGGDAGPFDAGGDGGAGTLACCNNRCVDTAADGKNCGACNVICGTGASCCASNCQDIVSTPTSCGGCGITCSANHIPSVSCGASACNGTCETGWGDCNMNKLTDGCETNIATDPDKCGGCNVVCSNANMATRTCSAGQCNGTCSGTFRDCNNNKQTDGCEIDIGANALHCGACNNPCSNTNIPVPTCAAGACNGTCAAGYSDCDNQKLINGCETKTSGAGADPNNCGGCGASFVCSSNHVPTRTCNGACNGTCEANWGDCDSNKLTNGCETQINGAGANPDHCGACGTSCSSNHMTTRTCNGTCNGTCESGWTDCNNNKQADGCEANTTNDSVRCGGTCTACAAGSRACINGVCTPGTTYGITPSSAAFVDACGQTGFQRFFATPPATNFDDDRTAVLTIPFSFAFYGTAYTQYSVATNGYVGFGATAVNQYHYGDECPLAVAGMNMPIIWAYNADLMPRDNEGLCVATVGNAGARKHVITWKNFRYYSSTLPAGTSDMLTFSIILNEGTNTVDVVYETMSNGAGGPTSSDIAIAGVQNATANNSTTYSCNAPGLISTGTKIRYFF